MSPALQIRNNVEDGCYEGVLEGKRAGAIVYKRFGDRVVIRHTVIEPQFRGRGLGTTLVRAFLDELRAGGNKLTNYCGFVADYISDNPEYRDIVDPDHPGVTPPREQRGELSVAPPSHE
jgi:predicted GNAT family acetyltransferase